MKKTDGTRKEVKKYMMLMMKRLKVQNRMSGRHHQGVRPSSPYTNIRYNGCSISDAGGMGVICPPHHQHTRRMMPAETRTGVVSEDDLSEQDSVDTKVYPDSRHESWIRIPTKMLEGDPLVLETPAVVEVTSSTSHDLSGASFKSTRLEALAEIVDITFSKPIKTFNL